MELTVQRWVSTPPSELWTRMFDLQQVVTEDPTLELVDAVGTSRPQEGACALLIRRVGRQLRELELSVDEVDDARHAATLTLRDGHDLWQLALRCAALPAALEGSEITVDVRRAGMWHPGAGRWHRAAVEVADLVDAWARSLGAALHEADGELARV